MAFFSVANDEILTIKEVAGLLKLLAGLSTVGVERIIDLEKLQKIREPGIPQQEPRELAIDELKRRLPEFPGDAEGAGQTCLTSSILI